MRTFVPDLGFRLSNRGERLAASIILAFRNAAPSTFDMFQKALRIVSVIAITVRFETTSGGDEFRGEGRISFFTSCCTFDKLLTYIMLTSITHGRHAIAAVTQGRHL